MEKSILVDLFSKTSQSFLGKKPISVIVSFRKIIRKEEMRKEVIWQINLEDFLFSLLPLLF